VTIVNGKATGAAIIAPPTAARHNPTFLTIRKNLDVGAVNRWTNDKFLVAILHIFKDECFDMSKPFFKEFDFLIHQIVYPFEFGFNKRSSGFHFCKVFFHTFKITVQLLCEKGHYRK
jgi:hypothetical protein